MQSRAIPIDHDVSFLELILRDPPVDPFSIVVLALIAGFIWVVWRNVSFD